MRLGKIVLKLRMARTRFGNMVLGAADLDMALSNLALAQETAFVIPLAENVTENKSDPGIAQHITERFGVVVALRNDTSQADKTGITAYEALYAARLQILKALVGWQLNEAVTTISYRGGKLLGMSPSYLWYQYEFEFASLLTNVQSDLGREVDIVTNDMNEAEDEVPAPFETVYTQFILSPDDARRLPYSGELPMPDGFPDVYIPDIAQSIDMTQDPRAGAFNDSFATGFDWFPKGGR